ncbi:acyloxyacyl hydrolase [Pleomorphomonas oryzae]|uniref:acyloxyacyl hydrolase n=1 Tax=Pleomorphomonas oryzae TaxID=261934 RepID=UPI000418D012|nr:acyloxyacyl hydrolase [Pleomorphomonas oryzae]
MQFGVGHRASVALMFVAILGGSLPAEAADATASRVLSGWSVYGGVGASNAGLFTTGDVNGALINAEVRAPKLDAPWWLFSPRPTLGVDIATKNELISDAYAGLTFTFAKYGDLSFEGQLGGSLNDAKLKDDPSGRRLGCHALFHLGLDLDWRVTENWSAQLYASHISNADLCDRNAGYESAGLRVGYHF